MQELTPKEYADLLNEDGELALEMMSDEQKLTLLLAKTLEPSGGASLRTTCSLCNGRGQRNGVECYFCHGTGLK